MNKVRIAILPNTTGAYIVNIVREENETWSAYQDAIVGWHVITTTESDDEEDEADTNLATQDVRPLIYGIELWQPIGAEYSFWAIATPDVGLTDKNGGVYSCLGEFIASMEKRVKAKKP